MLIIVIKILCLIHTECSNIKQEILTCESTQPNDINDKHADNH